MLKRFNKLSEHIVKIFFSIFIVLFSFFNIFFSVKVNNHDGSYQFNLFSNSYIYFIVLGIAILLFYFFKDKLKNINEKKLLTAFLIINLVIGLIWIFINDPILRDYDDAYNVFNAAVRLTQGDYSAVGYRSYINVYPNNAGILTYFFILIKLFGNYYSLFVIRIINLLISLIAYFYLYKLNDLLFNNKISNTILIAIFFFTNQLILYSFFVYGNCLSYSLGIISTYYFVYALKEGRYKFLILSSLLIILSIFFKSNSLIILVAETIYLIIYFLNKKKLIFLLAILLSLCGTYCCTISIQDFWANKGETDYSNTKLPTICWVAYGLNYEEHSIGHYTNEFENYHVQNDLNSEYTKIVVESFISNNLKHLTSNPKYFFTFYAKKFLLSWCNPQFEAFGQYSHLNNDAITESIAYSKPNTIIDSIWDVTMTFISIALLTFLYKKIRSIKLIDLMPAVIVIGGFLFHSFWEIKAIYLYQYFMYLLPYASIGLLELLASIKKKN